MDVLGIDYGIDLDSFWYERSVCIFASLFSSLVVLVDSRSVVLLQIVLRLEFSFEETRSYPSCYVTRLHHIHCL
jgi:hypothetical protein